MRQQHNQQPFRQSFPSFQAAKDYLAVRPQLQKNPLFFDPSVWSWVLVVNSQRSE